MLARITDKDGGFADLTTAVSVTNVAPTGTRAPTAPVDEGSSFTLAVADVARPVGRRHAPPASRSQFDCGAGFGPSGDVHGAR